MKVNLLAKVESNKVAISQIEVKPSKEQVVDEVINELFGENSLMQGCGCGCGCGAKS